MKWMDASRVRTKTSSKSFKAHVTFDLFDPSFSSENFMPFRMALSGINALFEFYASKICNSPKFVRLKNRWTPNQYEGNSFSITNENRNLWIELNWRKLHLILKSTILVVNSLLERIMDYWRWPNWKEGTTTLMLDNRNCFVWPLHFYHWDNCSEIFQRPFRWSVWEIIHQEFHWKCLFTTLLVHLCILYVVWCHTKYLAYGAEFPIM